jgi:hypothetical protein
MAALPDIDTDPSAFDIVSFDVEPGDVIIHHANTVHGSRGNILRWRAGDAASGDRYLRSLQR